MNDRQSRQLDSLHSAKCFLESNAASVPSVAGSGMRKDLDVVIGVLEQHVNNQASRQVTGQGITQRVMVLRASLLRDHMAPIAGIARMKLPQTPEFVAFRLPGERVGDYALMSAADAMGAAAAPFADVFVGAGSAPDFLIRLSEAVASLRTSREAVRQAQGQRSGASKGIQETVMEGRRVLRALDRFMESAHKDDSALLANWKMMIQVGKRRGAKKGGNAANRRDKTTSGGHQHSPRS